MYYYACVGVHVYVYTYIYAYVHTYKYLHTYLHASKRTYLPVSVPAARTWLM